MSKIETLRQHLLRLYEQHLAALMIPTSIRFLFYELVALKIVEKQASGVLRPGAVGHRPAATVPLYATYLFADVDQGPPWQAIRRQPGVISIVMTGDAPSRCPQSEIDKLKASEVHGLVQLADQPSPSDQKFALGERVKIKYGALDGHEAVYAGEADKRRKAQVLVCLLGRQVVVKIAADAIAAG
jgi:transcription antitermination factor NusG